MMLLHGIDKIMNGVDGISGMVEDAGMPAFIAYGVFVGEVVAPLLLIIGYRTKIAAAFFSVNVLFAAFLAHSEDILTLTGHGGWGVELLGLYFFGSLALVFLGGGRYAVSHKSRWD
jgi:putative oxidoreductase